MEATPVGYAGNDAFEQRKHRLRKFPKRGKAKRGKAKRGSAKHDLANMRTVSSVNKGRKGRTYASVFKDTNAKTSGGLEKKDIVRMSLGDGRYRYVSRARSMAAKRAYSSRDSAIKKWNRAVKAITGKAQVISKSHPDYKEVKREYGSY